MAEISVSAVLIEQDDGTYLANCPELDLSVQAEDSEEAFDKLKDAARKLVAESGPDNVKINYVKCLKFKVELG